MGYYRKWDHIKVDRLPTGRPREPSSWFGTGSDRILTVVMMTFFATMILLALLR